MTNFGVGGNQGAKAASTESNLKSALGLHWLQAAIPSSARRTVLKLTATVLNRSIPCTSVRKLPPTVGQHCKK